MPRLENEKADAKAEAFGRALLEDPLSDLQEFIDEAPTILSNEPLQLLEKCKAIVDARLAAEPEVKAFSLDDPHIIRFRLWGDIKRRLEAEINYRKGKATQKTGSDSTTIPPPETRARAKRNQAVQSATDRTPDLEKLSLWYESDADVLKRRQIVLKNPGMSDKSLCKLFDNQRIPLPNAEWETKYNVSTWQQACSNRELLQRIHKILSTDRGSGARKPHDP